MKKKSLLIIAMLLSTVAMLCQAQALIPIKGQSEKQATKVFMGGHDLNKYDMETKNGVTVFTPKFQATTPTLQSEGTVTVTVIAEYDKVRFRTSPVYMINENYLLSGFFPGYGDVTLNAVPGTYDLFTMFLDNEKSTPYVIIKELLEITKDTTITISPEECINYIDVKHYAPDGLQVKLGLYNSETQTFEGTDYFGVTVDDIIFLKDYNYSFAGLSLAIPEGQTTEELCYAPHGNYHINDVSNRILLMQIRQAIPQDIRQPWLMTYFSTDNVKVGYLDNDYSKYVYTEETYHRTPYGKQRAMWQNNLTGFGLDYYILRNDFAKRYGLNFVASIGYNDIDEEIFKFYIDVPEYDPISSNIQLLTGSRYIEYEDTVHHEIDYGGGFIYEYDDYIQKGLSGNRFVMRNGQKEYAGRGELFIDFGRATPNGVYNKMIEEYGYSEAKPFFTEQPAFTYPADKRTTAYGTSCPVNNLVIKNYTRPNSPNPISEILPLYTGRYCETRWSDFHSNEETLQFNGEEIIDLDEWIPTGAGVYERTYTNTNIEVDDLEGKNVTTVHYDSNQDDWTPPTLRMLQFKDNNDNITDRFATSADGIMEFTAGDFNFNGYVFDCKPVEVMVEYAPYSTEEWSELTVAEIPEIFQSPGFGFFYRGLLTGVTGHALKGWFDLRFRFTDEAGNWQEQVVSPAFRIDNLATTSVDDITPAHQNDDNAIYNITGQRMHGDLNSLPRGIYIVGGKKVVK